MLADDLIIREAFKAHNGLEDSIIKRKILWAYYSIWTLIICIDGKCSNNFLHIRQDYIFFGEKPKIHCTVVHLGQDYQASVSSIAYCYS